MEVITMTKLMVRPNDITNRWLDPMLEDFFSVPSILGKRTDFFMPKADITDTDHALIFTFEIPGMEKKDIHVSISNRVLSVTGRRETKKETEKDHIVRQEMFTGDFERQFTLPETVRTDDIEAKYSNGILTIELEKKEEVKPREVEVKVK
jgi:HSP20 family protein